MGSTNGNGNGERADELGAPMGEVAYWPGVAVGYAHDGAQVPRAVALSLVTPFGPLTGVLRPEVARTIGQQLVEHAGGCSELVIASELPQESPGK